MASMMIKAMDFQPACDAFHYFERGQKRVLGDNDICMRWTASNSMRREEDGVGLSELVIDTQINLRSELMENSLAINCNPALCSFHMTGLEDEDRTMTTIVQSHYSV